jgi:hypothetical protein
MPAGKDLVTEAIDILQSDVRIFVVRSHFEVVVRAILLAILVLMCTPSMPAQNSLTIDDPIREEVRVDNPRLLHPCASGIAVDQIARAAHVMVGFQNTRDCAPGPRSLKGGPNGENLMGMSARQAFDWWTASMPMYSWKRLNGVVVLRPTTAWEDPDDLLNQTVQPFQATNEYVDEILHVALRATTPSLFVPHVDVPRRGELSNRALSVVFSGGTMLDALNTIVLTHGAAEWEVGYTGYRAFIVVSTVAFPTDAVTAPAAMPQSRR